MVYCHSSCLDSLKLYAALWSSTHRNSRFGKSGKNGTLKRAMRQHSESTRTKATNRAAKTVSVPPPSADPAVDVGVGGHLVRQLSLRPGTLAILVATSLLGGSWVLWEKFFKKNAMKKSSDGEGVLGVGRQEFSQVLMEVRRTSSFLMPLTRLGF
jgi:hypothetical protein